MEEKKFRLRFEDDEVFFACNCTEPYAKAEVLLRMVKREKPRSGKRPKVLKVPRMQIRCQVCKEFKEADLQNYEGDLS